MLQEKGNDIKVIVIEPCCPFCYMMTWENKTAVTVRGEIISDGHIHLRRAARTSFHSTRSFQKARENIIILTTTRSWSLRVWSTIQPSRLSTRNEMTKRRFITTNEKIIDQLHRVQDEVIRNNSCFQNIFSE